MSQALGIEQLYAMKFNELEFSGAWLDLIGKPELTGSWIIWGNSGNGKTVFAAQLAKYMSQFCRVAYNPLEEGFSASFKRALKTAGVNGKTKITLVNRETISELRERLQKKKSPRVVIIDSLQYTDLTVLSYKKLLTDFPNKLFVFVSHADGKFPAGRVARAVRYDANVKIWVEGYKATAQSRYNGDSKDYIIWEKGAELYWINTKMQSNETKN